MNDLLKQQRDKSVVFWFHEILKRVKFARRLKVPIMLPARGEGEGEGGGTPLQK